MMGGAPRSRDTMKRDLTVDQLRSVPCPALEACPQSYCQLLAVAQHQRSEVPEVFFDRLL